VEIGVYVMMTVSVALGLISWASFSAFLCAAFGMGILLSASALLLEEASFHLYKRPRHLAALVGAILIENVGFRQLTAFWRFIATVGWLLKRPSAWGEMPRTAPWAERAPAETSTDSVRGHAA
jgi:hypothetical protein